MSTTQVIFAISNFVIVGGYLFVAFFVVPGMKITRKTQIWGSVFFITCASTHLELALHTVTQETLGVAAGHMAPHFLIIHVVQALSVWGFVVGLWREFVAPHRK